MIVWLILWITALSWFSDFIRSSVSTPVTFLGFWAIREQEPVEGKTLHFLTGHRANLSYWDLIMVIPAERCDSHLRGKKAGSKEILSKVYETLRCHHPISSNSSTEFLRSLSPIPKPFAEMIVSQGIQSRRIQKQNPLIWLFSLQTGLLHSGKSEFLSKGWWEHLRLPRASPILLLGTSDMVSVP